MGPPPVKLRSKPALSNQPPNSPVRPPLSPATPPNQAAALLQSFRGEQRVPVPIHPKERALIIVAVIHLSFLPWAIGTRDVWSQFTILGFALVSFVLSLLPRQYENEYSPEGPFRINPILRLIRFPVFWIGLVFVGYVLTQALNPAWTRMTDGSAWWLQSRDHITWLPTSVEAPVGKMNAWRMLSVYASIWLLGCALWTGLSRRTAVMSVLGALVFNGTVLAILGILQQVSHTSKILWFIKVPVAHPVATFVYENHGGAYFNLITFVAVGLMAWHMIRSQRRLVRSSPAPVYAIAAIITGMLVCVSNSRGALILLLVYVVVGTVLFGLWRIYGGEKEGNRTVSIIVAVVSFAFMGLGATYLNLGKNLTELGTLFNPATSEYIDFRISARNATMDLFKDKPMTGWGAGSFRHAFTEKQQHYPNIFRSGKDHVLFWDHAHNDYAQALAELGVIGFALPLCALGWLVWRLCRLGGLSQPAYILIVLGLGLIMAHSWMDFPLYNPAILTTFCAVWILTVRWSELETTR